MQIVDCRESTTVELEVGLETHRDSIAWQKGMRLTALVYGLTKSFPREEMFGLTSQLRRAAVSVPSNIAEGKGRGGRAELLQFLCIARGSALEVQTQLEIAAMLGFGERAELDEAGELVTEVVRILHASIATMRARGSSGLRDGRRQG